LFDDQQTPVPLSGLRRTLLREIVIPGWSTTRPRGAVHWRTWQALKLRRSRV